MVVIVVVPIHGEDFAIVDDTVPSNTTPRTVNGYYLVLGHFYSRVSSFRS